MNSTAGDDGDFPPNPFRSDSAPQQQQQNDFSFAQAPPVAQQQFVPQPAFAAAPAPYAAAPAPYASAPAPYAAAPAPYATPPQPVGQMNAGAATLPPGPQSRWQACMSCFRMDTYMAYFDVDTADISARIQGAVLLFYQPDKFRAEVVGASRTEALKGPDLYGPLWITMTLVFFVAVSKITIST